MHHRLEARRNQIIFQKGTDSGEQEFILTKPPPEFPPARFFLINFHIMSPIHQEHSEPWRQDRPKNHPFSIPNLSLLLQGNIPSNMHMFSTIIAYWQSWYHENKELFILWKLAPSNYKFFFDMFRPVCSLTTLGSAMMWLKSTQCCDNRSILPIAADIHYTAQKMSFKIFCIAWWRPDPDTTSQAFVCS